MNELWTTCPCCEVVVPIDELQVRHRNTAYVDDRLNYLESCEDCYNEDYEYYQDLWEDYWRGRL